MANLFETELGIPKPKCCSTGDCCKGVSPSTPTRKLQERAAAGDEFARNFFSIMMPYPSHQAARAVVPGVVEKTLAAAQKLPEFENGAEDVVFYHCKFLQADNRCGVHEDRPQFCRDYPDTPFVVMAPGCAYLPWAEACKKKYNAMKTEVDQLNRLKGELARLKSGQATLGEMSLGTIDPPLWHALVDGPVFSADNQGAVVGDSPLAGDSNLSLVLSLTDIYLASPMRSFFWIF